jgi:hypothetical protein
MVSNQALFELIKSLSQAEKSYFKKHNGKGKQEHAKNNYVLLFEAIDKQDSYDETKLLKKFNAHKFVNQFSVAKHYLYNLILKSLEAGNTTITHELNSIVERVEILMKKTLYDQSMAWIGKGKKLSLKHERYLEFVKLNELEKVVLMLSGKLHLSVRDQDPYDRAESLEALQKTDNAIRLEELKYRMHGLQWEIEGRDEIKEANQLLHDFPIQEESACLSEKARHSFHFSHCYHQSLIGNALGAYEHSKLMIEIVETNTELFAEGTGPLSTYSNHILRCTNAGKMEEGLAHIQKLRALPGKELMRQARILYLSYYMEFTLYIETGTYAEALSAIPDFEEKLKPFAGVLGPIKLLNVNYMISYLLVLNGEYMKAMMWLEKLLEIPETSMPRDIQFAGRILELIICFEQEKFDVFDSRLRSVYRQFQKAGDEADFVGVLTSHFKRIVKANDDMELAALCRKAKDALGQNNTGMTLSLLHYIDLDAWFESKIGGVEFSLLAAEKKKAELTR